MRGCRRSPIIASLQLGILLHLLFASLVAALDHETFEKLLQRVSSLSRTTSPDIFKEFAKDVRRTIRSLEPSHANGRRVERRSGHNETTTPEATTLAPVQTSSAQATTTESTTVAQTTAPVPPQTPPPQAIGFRNAGAPRPLEGQVYYVTVYHRPPFVLIGTSEAGIPRDAKDPGNVNQTRKAENGGIRGLTIDVLENIALITGCEFRYLYPCRAGGHATSQTCNAESSADALAMLDAAQASEFFGGLLCAEQKCLSAGAHKTTEELLRDHRASQHYLTGGFELVAVEAKPKPVLNTWNKPFAVSLWVLLAAEMVLVGAVLFAVEYGFNPELPKNYLGAFFESVYWAFSTVMGIASHSPETHAGRTITMAQLFVTLLVVAIYTGNLAANLLLTEPVTVIQTLSDLADTTRDTYLSGGSVCVATAHPSVTAYLDSLARGLGLPLQEAFAIVEKDTLLECMRSVFEGESTTTFYDSAVIRANLVDEFRLKGVCGAGGAYCTNPELSRGQCKCPPRERKEDGTCDDSLYDLVEGDGDLTLIGNKFGEFGYSLIFDPDSRDYQSFDLAIAELRELGWLEEVKEDWLPHPEEVACAGTSGDEAVVLTFFHLQGLCLFCGIVAVVGLVVAVGEKFTHLIVACLDKIFLDEAKRKRLSKYPMYDPANPPDDILPPPPGGPITEREHYLIMGLQDRMQQIESRLAVSNSVLERFDEACGVDRPPPPSIDEILKAADEDGMEEREAQQKKRGLYGQTMIFLFGRTPSDAARAKEQRRAQKAAEQAEAAALARKTAVEGGGKKEKITMAPPPIQTATSRLKGAGAGVGSPPRPKSAMSGKSVSFKAK